MNLLEGKRVENSQESGKDAKAKVKFELGK